MRQLLLSALLLTLTTSPQALTPGDTLPPLHFDTTPHPFNYSPNGKKQVITIYPAKPSSQKASKINKRLYAQGHCAISITDIKHKAWYAPVSAVESAMAEQINSGELKPGCTVSGDYDGVAVATWDLEEGIATIVVDGRGKIEFIAQGALNEQQQLQVLELMNAESSR